MSGNVYELGNISDSDIFERYYKVAAFFRNLSNVLNIVHGIVLTLKYFN